MYSQKDQEWKNEKLGGTLYAIGDFGCYLVSIANLEGTNPLTLNELLTRRQCFQNGLILSQKVAEVLGYTYSKYVDIRGKKLPNIVICETDHYKKKGYPQHFFLYDRKEKKRIDPLDLNPQWEGNDYRIVSYRVFEKKEVVKDKEKTEEPSITFSAAMERLEKINNELQKLKENKVAEPGIPVATEEVQVSEDVQYNEELPTRKETIVLLIVIAFLILLAVLG